MKYIYSLACYLLLCCIFGFAAEEANLKRPNIIIIYTDDQGYGDVSALNAQAKFKTPYLDQLVREGIAFTNGHSPDSVCTPSRYSLLTGRYSWRTTLKKGVMGSHGKCLIADGRMTIASLLRDNGYNTGMVGKWHLGMQFPGDKNVFDWSKPIQDMPLDKGFDYYFGIPASLNYGILAWFEGRFAAVPPTLYTNKKPNDRHVDYRIMPPYDMTAEETKKILKMEGFLVAPDFIDNQCLTRFTDKAIAWMQSKIPDAKNGKPFFLYLPYTSPHYPVCPLPEYQGQGNSGAYGEFVIETDNHIGRILSFLSEAGIDNNTLIFFSSDNGPEKSWAERIKEFNHDSRGGFKEGKRSVYEGGHRVPFIVRWPAGIKEPGRTWNKIVGQVDILATCAEVIGVQLPDNAGEDSFSFAPVLKNQTEGHVRPPLINHGNGGGRNRLSITEGDWKLVMPDGKARAELYNLANDPSETKNIANDNDSVVQQLTNKINTIITSGRSTAGTKQKNDTGYWDTLAWITAEQYNKLAGE